MADNYLERRMEDYRAGRNSRTHTPTRRGVATITFRAERIAVIGVESDISIAAVSELVKTGCRVAFTCADGANGQHIAQQTGGAFFPMSAVEMFERLASKSDSPTVCILAKEPTEPLPDLADVRLFTLNFEHPQAVAVIGTRPDAIAATLTVLVAAPKLPPQTIRV